MMLVLVKIYCSRQCPTSITWNHSHRTRKVDHVGRANDAGKTPSNTHRWYHRLFLKNRVMSHNCRLLIDHHNDYASARVAGIDDGTMDSGSVFDSFAAASSSGVDSLIEIRGVGGAGIL